MPHSETINVGQMKIRYLIDGSATGGVGAFETDASTYRMGRCVTLRTTSRVICGPVYQFSNPI